MSYERNAGLAVLLCGRETPLGCQNIQVWKSIGPSPMAYIIGDAYISCEVINEAPR